MAASQDTFLRFVDSLNVAGAEAAVHVQVILFGQRVDVIDLMTFDKDAKISSLRTY